MFNYNFGMELIFAAQQHNKHWYGELIVKLVQLIQNWFYGISFVFPDLKIFLSRHVATVDVFLSQAGRLVNNAVSDESHCC